MGTGTVSWPLHILDLISTVNLRPGSAASTCVQAGVAPEAGAPGG